MPIGMAVSSTHSTMAGPTPVVSVSKPMMKPAITNMPARLMRWTLSAMLRRVFCFFWAWTSVASSGLSMPTKTMKKFASRIIWSSSASSARLSEASVERTNG